MKEKNILKQTQRPKPLKWFRRLVAGIYASTIFYSTYAFAQLGPGGGTQGGGGQSIGQIATTVTGSFSGLAKLITAASYIAGIGFALSAILKFKQHKDNPTQIPIGTPIALLFIAAALIFMPTIFGIANQTVFGGSGASGGVSGVSG